jgi:hypothetical protein
MALKDWKRLPKKQKDVTEWGNKNSSETIGIAPNSSPIGATKKNKWSVWLGNAFDYGDEEIKKQYTESQALKFAKEYMRTH